MDNRIETYNFVCFSELAYEWNPSDRKNVETKIKKRLKANNEKYIQSRIDYIRSLRNDLFDEISLSKKSRYFAKPNFEYADIADFNTKQMLLDFEKKYNEITKEDLLNIIEFAIYLFYVR